MWRPTRQLVSRTVLWCDQWDTDHPCLKPCNFGNGLINHQHIVAASIHHNNYILLTGNRLVTPEESDLLFSFGGGSDVVLQSERWEAHALEPDWPTHARVISKKTFCHESIGITLNSSLAWNTTSHVPGHNIQQILNRSYPQSNTATRTNRTSVYV